MTQQSSLKRPAIEPATTLLGAEQRHVVAKRPLTTSLGALFVLGRSLAGLLWVGAFWLSWPELLRELDIERDIEPYVAWFVIGGGIAGSLVLLALAWAVWHGSNLARVLVMSGLTLSTVSAAIGYFANGEEITIQTTLLTLALDILVLLALSSRGSRAWARRSRSKR